MLAVAPPRKCNHTFVLRNCARGKFLPFDLCLHFMARESQQITTFTISHGQKQPNEVINGGMQLNADARH